MSGFEVLGAVAAAGQFVEQGTKIIKLANEILAKAKNAPEEIERCRDQLEALNTLAQKLQNNSRLSKERDIVGVLTRCRAHSSELEKILKKVDFNRDDPFGRKYWRVIKGINKEGDITGILNQLEREKSTLVNLVLVTESETTQAQLSSINTQLDQFQAQGIGAAPSLADQCISKLYLTNPIDHRDQLLTMKGDVLPGTCEWIEARDDYKKLLNSRGCNLLWVSGGPGKGKTMLSIYLTKALEARQSEIVTYFFCDNKDDKRSNASAIIRGLLYMLLRQGASSDILAEEWKFQGGDIFTESGFDSLWNIFGRTIRTCTQKVIILIDGLDECDSVSMEPLLRKLRDIFLTKSINAKGIIVSREYPDTISSTLRGCCRIRLDPDSKEEVDTGIEVYIKAKVDELAADPAKNLPTSLQDHITNTIMKKAQGTYLWASFVLEELSKIKSSEIERRLDEFPAGLDGIYERMLMQIPSRHQEDLVKLLSWIVFAKETLNVGELAIALDIKATRHSTAEDIVRDRVSYCGHFLTINDFGTVRLVHQSAKDFFSHRVGTRKFPRLDPDQSHYLIADRCLQYLKMLSSVEDEVLQEIHTLISDRKDKGYPLLHIEYLSRVSPTSRNRLSKRRFWQYAVAQWHNHCQCLEGRMLELIESHASFFAAESAVRYSWILLTEIDGVLRNRSTRFPDLILPPTGATALQVAAVLGLKVWAKAMLKKRVRLKRLSLLDQPELKGKPPLRLAIEMDHEEITELLIDKKTLSKLIEEDWNPLEFSLKRQNTTMTRRLLQCGADPNSKFIDGTAPLHWAARRRLEEITEVLLEHGADPNIMCTQQSRMARVPFSPLHEVMDPSSTDGSIDPGTKSNIASMLLKYGADPDIQDGLAQTSLHAATLANDRDLVQLLLRGKAHIESRDFLGMTSLDHAANSGLYSMFKLLLKNMPESSTLMSPNVLTGDGIIHYAVRGGSSSILEMVLAMGISPKITNYKDNSPLHDAARHGNSIAVKTLLEQEEPDPDALGEGNRTPLHMSLLRPSSNENAISAWQLLFLTKNLNHQDMDGNTPLHLAVINGHEMHVMKLLADPAVDPSICNNRNQTALLIFAKEWRGLSPLSILDVLLASERVDCKAKDENGRSALAITAARDDYFSQHEVDLITKLLQSGKFDVDEPDNAGNTPMMLALKDGATEQQKLPTSDLLKKIIVPALLVEYGAKQRPEDISNDTTCGRATESSTPEIEPVYTLYPAER